MFVYTNQYVKNTYKGVILLTFPTASGKLHGIGSTAKPVSSRWKCFSLNEWRH